MFKRFLASCLILALLALPAAPAAYAVSLRVGGTTVSGSLLYRGVTYVPLRPAARLLCPGAAVSWSDGQAVVKTSALTLTARPGECWIGANGRMLFVRDGVLLRNGTTYVPVRVLAKATGASVRWDSAACAASVSPGSGTITPGSAYYNADSLYWLSRIISAESGGEPLFGKIAVGDVILNRVASPDFPDTIYDVIFDKAGGTQFTPVANGTVYNVPNSDSVLAAKLCLDGASVAGASLFFLNPATASSSWIISSRSYVGTIGNHAFYA